MVANSARTRHSKSGLPIWRVTLKSEKGKFAQFCVRVKKRTEDSGRHHVTCVISVKKLDDCQGVLAASDERRLEEPKPLIEFLKRTVNLAMNTDSREGTTRYGTTIDAVFPRFLD
ncbi:hypothetical protein TNCV_3911291 [Trichonephila clavipes]|nr:hypothetical protein TNCV_3911291 [Trichonephila clavipes]